VAVKFVVRTPQQLGSLMKAFRKQAGLTQTDLGKQLGISRQAVTALEHEPETASFGRLMKVWAVLGIEVTLQQGTDRSSNQDMEW